MRIVFVIDKNYAEYARVSIESYKKFNPSAVIIVVSETPLPKDIGYDENIIWDLSKWTFKNKGTGDRISKAAYFKLFLTNLPYSKILYVDADTICQKPLDDLWEIPCKYINLCESHKYGKIQAEAIGVERYGLTGMMVMNLDNLREIDFTKRCLDIQKNYDIPSEWWQHDETCINLGMKGLLNFIDKKYNYCRAREYDNPINEEDASILHYVGANKDGPFAWIHYPELFELRKEIEGKRIAIVGNAESIFEKKNGWDINQNDFIIRFNRGFIVNPECQGTRTDFLITAANLSDEEIKQFNPRYTANRSSNYCSNTDFIINNKDRCIMASSIGSQPSTGFMAVNICLYFRAREINLYGFGGEKEKTFYNTPDYQTQHNYKTEQEILRGYEAVGLLKFH